MLTACAGEEATGKRDDMQDKRDVSVEPATGNRQPANGLKSVGFTDAATWGSIVNVIARFARCRAPAQLRDDVIQEAQMRILIHLQRGGCVGSWPSFAVQVARSALSWLRRQAPATHDLADDHDGGDEEQRLVPFDELVARAPRCPMKALGPTQALLVGAVTAGTNFESLSGGCGRRLAKLRYAACRLAEALVVQRKIEAHMESPDSIRG